MSHVALLAAIRSGARLNDLLEQLCCHAGEFGQTNESTAEILERLITDHLTQCPTTHRLQRQDWRELVYVQRANFYGGIDDEHPTGTRARWAADAGGPAAGPAAAAECAGGEPDDDRRPVHGRGGGVAYEQLPLRCVND